MKTVKNILTLAASALLLFSCTQEDLVDPGRDAETGSLLTVTVSDAGYASADSVPETKASDTGYQTTFESGDAIGVYVVEGGEISQPNVKLTYNGSAWEGDLRLGKEGAKYFAYYPYNESIQETELTATASDADGFFTTYLENINLSTDQSDQSKYSSADIMTATGTPAGESISFKMVHRMALVVIELPTKADVVTEYSLNTDANYKWNVVTSSSTNITEPSFTGFKPFTVDGKYRYLVKPGTANLGGSFKVDGTVKNYSFNPSSVTSGQYKTYQVSASNVTKKTHTLTKGDFFMKDGSLVAYNTTLSEQQKKDCIGIVFQTDASRIGSKETEIIKGKGFTKAHGLVMALKDASSSAKWKNTADVDESNLTNCTSLDQCLNGDLSGLKNSNEIWTKYSGGSLSTFPAFEYAKNYNTKVSVSTLKTTGWFLPSINQWSDILKNLGGTDMSGASGSGDFYIEDKAKPTADAIDVYLNKVGGSYVDKVAYSGSDIRYWSSSECSSSGARSVYFSNNGKLYLYYDNKTSNNRVRCVLAF